MADAEIKILEGQQRVNSIKLDMMKKNKIRIQDATDRQLATIQKSIDSLQKEHDDVSKKLTAKIAAANIGG